MFAPSCTEVLHRGANTSVQHLGAKAGEGRTGYHNYLPIVVSADCADFIAYLQDDFALTESELFKYQMSRLM